MRQEERYEDREEALRVMLDGFKAGLWTAMPAIVDEFDAEKQICKCTIAIQGVVFAVDGTSSLKTITQLIKVPVYRLRGGGFAATVPLSAGDEGVVLFMSRCYDNWWQLGGIQPPFENRFLDLSDGMFFPGFNSQTKNLADYSTDSIQLRNDAGDTYVEVKNGQLVNIVAPGGCNINGVVIDADGNMNVPGDITGGGAQAVKLADGSNSTKLKGT